MNKRLWPSWYVPNERHTGGDVLRYVARRFGTTVDELRGQGRHTNLIHARAAAAAILIKRGNGFTGTARILKRDHSTIIYSHGKLEAYMARDPLVGEVIDRFMAGAL